MLVLKIRLLKSLEKYGITYNKIKIEEQNQKRRCKMRKRNSKNGALVVGMLMVLLLLTPKLSYAGLSQDIVARLTNASSWLNDNIISPAKQLVGLEKKEPADSYSKYIGVDEKMLTASTQERIKKMRDTLSNGRPGVFLLKTEKPFALTVFSDTKHSIEYLEKEKGKLRSYSGEIQIADDPAEIPSNAKWVEYKGEHKGRSYYEKHNLKKSDFLGTKPLTLKEAEKMASYDAYAVIKYFPKIEGAYHNTSFYWDEIESNEIYPTETNLYGLPDSSNGEQRYANLTMRYLKPESMQNFSEETEKSFYWNFPATAHSSEKEEIDSNFENIISTIEHQRSGFSWIDGEYYSNCPDKTGTCVGDLSQETIDSISSYGHRFLTEQDINSMQEELIRLATAKERISSEVLEEIEPAENETVAVNETIFEELVSPTPERFFGGGGGGGSSRPSRPRWISDGITFIFSPP